MQIKSNKIRSTIFLTAILAAGLISVAAVAAEDYYKWTDDEGVTHYSARKPHNREAEAISIRTGERSTVPTGSSSGEKQPSQRPAATENTETDNTKLVDPERCKVARSNLDVLRNNAKVRMKDENGEIHYLNEEEKAEKAREFQQAIDESC